MGENRSRQAGDAQPIPYLYWAACCRPTLTCATGTFTYDAEGSRTVVEDSNGGLVTYAYDPKDRLVQEATSGLNTHVYDYGYDGVDNRLTCTETGNLATTTYDAAQRIVTSVEAGLGVATYAYDKDGNLIAVQNPDGTWITLTYDEENRLTVHQDGASVATYTHDGDGLKRSELVDGALTTLVWDGSDYLQGRS